MKRLLILITLLTSLTLSSCQGAFQDKTDSSQASDTSEQTTVTENPPDSIETEETGNSVADSGYLNIECREPEGYEYQLFAANGDIRGFSIELPKEWIFEKSSDNTFAIKRGGATIGKAVCDKIKNTGYWDNVYSGESVISEVLMQTNIEKNTQTGEYRYRLYFSASDGDAQKSLTFTADYSEISEKTLSIIRRSLRFKRIGVEPEVGLIDIEKSRSNSILIVGNSFINSSKVGYILDEMIRKTGRDTYVEHISRGYAHVDTYSEDSYIMSRIKSGEFGAVFVCGYYNNDQADPLAKIKKVCNASGTALFMFPAHNEHSASIKYVQEQVGDIHILNWKNEVQSFIDNGGNQWDFCINDMHLHSTPLAGYIGAHMIYRAIYGEMPDCSVSEYVSQIQVDTLLPGYADSGIIYLTKGAILNVFG